MQIKTIDELRIAQEKDPEFVDNILRDLQVVRDLEAYYRYLQESGAHMTGEFDISHSTRSLGVHPSSASKKDLCPLSLYYECTGEITAKEHLTLQNQMTFDIGTMLHSMMQSAFSDMYQDQFQKEFPIKNEEMHIDGHADGLLTFSDHRVIIELKTIKEGGNFGWERVQSKPLDDHPRQTILYMACSDVPFRLILYINKNTGALKEHVAAFDFALWEEMQSTLWPIVDAAYNKGPMVTSRPGSACMRCKFSHACKDKKEVKRR